MVFLPNEPVPFLFSSSAPYVLLSCEQVSAHSFGLFFFFSFLARGSWRILTHRAALRCVGLLSFLLLFARAPLTPAFFGRNK